MITVVINLNNIICDIIHLHLALESVDINNFWYCRYDCPVCLLWNIMCKSNPAKRSGQVHSLGKGYLRWKELLQWNGTHISAH
jgi:hypothetical protein